MRLGKKKQDAAYAAIHAAAEAPAEGVSPTAVVAALRAVINGCLDPHTPMCGDDAELAPFLRRVLRAKDQAVHNLRRRLAAITEPKSRELDAALTVLETLQKDGYYLHRADGTLLDDQQEFVAAVVHALDAIAPVEPTGVSPQPNLMICPACLGSGRGCGLCAGTGDVQDMPAPPVSPVEPTPPKWIPTDGCDCATCNVARRSVEPAPEPPTLADYVNDPFLVLRQPPELPTVEPEPCVWTPVGSGPLRRAGCRDMLETLSHMAGWKACPYCTAPLKIDGRTP